MDAMGAITRKLGPLPVWGWALALGGSILFYRKLTGKGTASGTSTTVGATSDTSGFPTGSMVSQLSASDIADLRAALAEPPGQMQVPSTTSPPTTPVDFAATKSPFGTAYPSYVHTQADAMAWINRALHNGAKPITSIAISSQPVH